MPQLTQPGLPPAGRWDSRSLGWHQKEFQTRRSFAYTVVSLDESMVLGCVYLNPSSKRDYDAVAFLWAR